MASVVPPPREGRLALPPNRPALTVDLQALSRNLEVIRSRAGEADVAPVIKADAYGLGAAEVARHLAEHAGVTAFFVAYAHQAERVRHAVNKPGIGQVDIYVLNGFNEADSHRHDLLALRPVLNTKDEAAAWTRHGGPCALGVDIGMNRLGLSPWDLPSLCRDTGLNKHDVALVVMHLSHASTPEAEENASQIAMFEAVAEANKAAFPNARFSLSASGGLALSARPGETLVRPGISLYGGSPTGKPEDALEPVASLTAPVLLMRDVEPGETVGYSGRWTADRHSKLSVLALGYADGYFRSLSGKGRVFLGGTECPVVGAVSMDLLIVDVTDAGPVAVGDRAEAFGKRIPIDRLAAEAGTISYEILTAVGDWVERVYKR